MKTTSSIYMTAAFLALGAKLEDINKTDPKHMIFTLGFPPEVMETTIGEPPNATISVPISAEIDAHNMDVWEKAWANGTLMVNAVKFMEAIQRLKSIIHSV